MLYRYNAVNALFWHPEYEQKGVQLSDFSQRPDICLPLACVPVHPGWGGGPCLPLPVLLGRVWRSSWILSWIFIYDHLGWHDGYDEMGGWMEDKFPINTEIQCNLNADSCCVKHQSSRKYKPLDSMNVSLATVKSSCLWDSWPTT